MSSEQLERLETLAALVASGGASDQEHTELQSLQAEFPEAALGLQEFDDALAQCALDFQELPPPSGALQAILAAVDSEKDRDKMVPAKRESSLPTAPEKDTPIVAISSKRRSPGLWVSSALFLSVAAAFALMWNQARKRNQQLSDRVASLESDIVSVDTEWSEKHQGYRAAVEAKLARFELLQSPKLSLATLGQDSGATIKILMEPEGKRWLVYGFDLPELPNKDYQLWFIPKEGAPIPAGILAPIGGGIHELEVILPTDVENISQAAVSLEPKGGSESPTEVQMIGPI